MAVQDYQDQLSITVARDDVETVVMLAGELDLATAPTLEARLGQLNGHHRLIVDCARLTFCDSTGIASLLRHSPVVVRSPQPQLVRVLSITGLSDLIED
jgi:anti-anti-sigma factor